MVIVGHLTSKLTADVEVQYILKTAVGHGYKLNYQNKS